MRRKTALLPTASIEKSAFDVRAGGEGRLLENDDPAGMVEDNRFLLLASERAAVKAGYDVVSVVDGEAALLMGRERIPSLILLDMMLPKLDGLGVLRALKHDAQTADIAVIVLSGLGQQNEAKLKKESAAAYFTKSDSFF
jgi:DNA-binding response OmpR family regulator